MLKNSSGYCVVLLSPPSWWSGLKSHALVWHSAVEDVSTLVVEWIEIIVRDIINPVPQVSTLVVEWIEIHQIGF